MLYKKKSGREFNAAMSGGVEHCKFTSTSYLALRRTSHDGTSTQPYE